MLFLQIIAAICLFLSAALFFAPTLIVYGPRAFSGLKRSPEARLAGGFIGSLAVLLVVSPFLGQALTSGGNVFAQTAIDLINLSFGLA